MIDRRWRPGLLPSSSAVLVLLDPGNSGRPEGFWHGRALVSAKGHSGSASSSGSDPSVGARGHREPAAPPVLSI